MSQENVKLVRAGFEAWNTGDMDALRELYDPAVVLRNPEGWPESGPFVGREAVMRQRELQRENLGRRRPGAGQRLRPRCRPSSSEIHLAWRRTRS
jgi:ketosteroid isomerase-like protein